MNFEARWIATSGRHVKNNGGEAAQVLPTRSEIGFHQSIPMSIL